MLLYKKMLLMTFGTTLVRTQKYYCKRFSNFYVYSHTSFQGLKISSNNMAASSEVRASTVLLALTVEGFIIKVFGYLPVT